MIATLTRNAIVFLLLAVAMWASSLWVYDDWKTRQALEWRDAVLEGRSPFSWPLESRWEVSSGNGIEDFEWTGHSLKGALNDPYIYLDLQGRYVDAKRYTLLAIRLYSEDDDELRLFHHQLREDEIHYSEELTVSAGWQELRLDLPALSWQARDLAADGAKRAQPSAWGSPAGLVSAIRIDPVTAGAFEIDTIELLETEPELPANAAIVNFSGSDDPLFQSIRDGSDPARFLAHDRWLRSPETAQRTRMEIAREFPSLVVFPRPVRDSDLAAPVRSPLTLPATVFGVAVLLFLLRKRVSPALKPAVESIAFLAMLGAFIFIEPHLPRWGVPMPVLLLGAAAWLMKPVSLKGTFIGDRRAWLPLSPLIAAAVLIIAFAPHNGPQDSPLWQTIAIYLAWALAQQFVVAVLIMDRLEATWKDYAVVLGAGAFAMLHFPNFALMMGTFVLGLYLLTVFRRHRNLPAIATAHALAAVAVNLSAPYLVWLSREIGPRFLQAL